MSTTFRNSSFNSNINAETFSIIPSDLTGHSIEIQFPTMTIGAGSLNNNLASTSQGYTMNNRSMTQSYKSTFYVEGHGTISNTLHGLDKSFPKHTIDNDMKSKYVTQAWKEIYNKSERIAKDDLRETNGNIELTNTKEVERYFQQAQSVIAGRVKKPTEKFKRPNYEQENDHIGVQNIRRGAVGETATLDNRANIRTVMGNRSLQNQERIQAENEAKAKLLALKEAQKTKIRRHEEVKGVKFADSPDLSNTLIIPNTEKLMKAVNNDAKKAAMKEAEKKNSKGAKKQGGYEKKTLAKKSSNANVEAPRASSAPKKPQQAPEEDKKYVFSAKKIKKLPTESQADYKTRFNYTVMAQPHQKENLDPVQQHQITKKFHELILKSGVEKNGRVALEAKK